MAGYKASQISLKKLTLVAKKQLAIYFTDSDSWLFIVKHGMLGKAILKMFEAFSPILFFSSIDHNLSHQIEQIMFLMSTSTSSAPAVGTG